MFLILFLSLAACAPADRSSEARLRGVPFPRRSLYEGDEFECLDGSARIPAAYINDDYCDCGDGSDEPGTSACPSGAFYCVNLGHKGTMIPSSRVGDSLCDCCDGSDEWQSTTTVCPNICDEIGRAAREEAERQAAAQREGFAKKADLVKEATRLREDKQKQLETWQAERDILDPQKDDLQVAKTEAEQAEKAVKDAREAAWKEAKEALRRERAETAFAALDKNGDGVLQAAELQSSPEFDKDADGTVTLEEAQYYLIGKDQADKVGKKSRVDSACSNEFGRPMDALKETFIADVWDGLRAVYGRGGPLPPAPPMPTPGGGERLEDAPEIPGSADDHGDEDEPGDDEGIGSGVNYTEHGPVPATKPDMADHESGNESGESEEVSKGRRKEVNGVEVEDFDADKYTAEGTVSPSNNYVEEDEVPEPELDEEGKATVAKAEEARQAFDEADRKLRELQDNIREAEEALKMDFGPDGVFWPLKGNCVELAENQYVYRFCPFEKATQRDKNHGGETNLGVWGEWSGPEEARYSELKMTRGTACWNGPERRSADGEERRGEGLNRSTVVKLECGTETRLLSATEPGRCEYEFRVETPAVCTDPNALHAADEL